MKINKKTENSLAVLRRAIHSELTIETKLDHAEINARCMQAY